MKRVVLIALVLAASTAWPDERPANDKPLRNENTWEYIQRNHLEGVLGVNTIEISPRTPLLTAHPWAIPKPTDDFYNAAAERAIAAGSSRIARIYKAGVFQAYVVITTTTESKFMGL